MHSKKFRELAKICPHCMSCGLENPNGDLLCLAHSNRYEDGRGYGHKSDDLFGAFLCHNCHMMVDGQIGKLDRFEKRQKHNQAWQKSIRWLIRENLITLRSK
tara:strand:+ start:499 stop:804 length:306 start_codon:yes stop_codon:yes gene_type:complete